MEYQYETYGGVGPLDLLKRKRMVKPQPVFKIKLKHGEIKEKKREEGKEKHEEDEEKEEKKEIVKRPHKIIFSDKRDDVNVNRDLILAKLNKHINVRVVEKDKKQMETKEYKIPIIQGDVYERKDTGVPLKMKKTITISEKMGEEIEKGDLEEELPDILEEPPEPEIELEPKKLEPEPEPEKVKIKPKRGRKKKTEEPEAELKKPEPEAEQEEKPEKPEPEVIKFKPKRDTRKIYEEYKFGDIEIDKNMKIGKKLLINRLPKKEKMVVRTSNYYMNNRKMYIQKIAELFKPYRKELLDSKSIVSCEYTGKVDFKLLMHQKVIRDYLNLYTPYRGLLLYHGLGSGKTCSSIAIAEGMKTERPVVLMTPASLKMNFFSELKKCGDVMYRKNQYWEFIQVEGKPEYVSILSKILQIPSEMIKKKRGAWLVDMTKKESNFEDLSTEQQKEIDEQLDKMIRAKYNDINYNGLNRNKLNEMTDNLTKNPFDNTTVIIDEAHNFVSRIVNKIKTKDSISYILYDYLMKATNCKIVLLTGTPIINYPNELGILFNILRGYIKKWSFQLRIKNTAPSNFKLTKETLMKMFQKEHFNIYDYMEYSGNTLTITRNPYGFISTYSAQKGGKSKTSKNKMKIKHRNTKKTKNTSMFYVENGMIKKNEIQNEEEYEPEETAEYDQRIYHDIHGGGIEEDYNGITLDETGNMTDEEFKKEITRILNKNHIEISKVGSTYEELKALPDESDSFISMFINDDMKNIKNENTFKKRILGLTSYFRSAEEKLLPSFIKTDNGENYHIVPVEMSEYQFSTYEKIRKEEAQEEKRNRQNKGKKAKKGDAEDLYKNLSTYRIFSRAACNFAFPTPPGRPMPNKDSKEEMEMDMDESMVDALSPDELPKINEFVTDEDVENIKSTQKEPLDYQNRIKTALKMLKYDESKSEDEQYLTKNKLEMYSPKFARILENILDKENKGLHLLYSQFRTIEGIGILKLVLEANGFSEFKIKKNDSMDTWDIIENPGDEGKPKFVLYTGTETPEEKEIIRNIYNSTWEFVPASITTKLREISSNNHYGEIIKMMMITSSGAEGINLKNTRFVHIVEPYWHMVRIEQVIGRARRICSHQDLPEELRTVKVFLYLSIFSNEQKTNKKNIDMMNRDTSRIDGRPITTDESLLDIAVSKVKINNALLDAVKETAIDCSLYNSKNKEEKLVCYGFGKVTSNAFASYPTLEQDMGEMEEINVRKTRIKLKETKPIDGVIYAIDPKTLELYDLESYKQMLEGKGELIYIGKAVKTSRGQFRIDKT
jgi:hypothetical protein